MRNMVYLNRQWGQPLLALTATRRAVIQRCTSQEEWPRSSPGVLRGARIRVATGSRVPWVGKRDVEEGEVIDTKCYALFSVQGRYQGHRTPDISSKQQNMDALSPDHQTKVIKTSVDELPGMKHLPLGRNLNRIRVMVWSWCWIIIWRFEWQNLNVRIWFVRGHVLWESGKRMK